MWASETRAGRSARATPRGSLRFCPHSTSEDDAYKDGLLISVLSGYRSLDPNLLLASSRAYQGHVTVYADSRRCRMAKPKSRVKRRGLDKRILREARTIWKRINRPGSVVHGVANARDPALQQ